MTGPPPRPAPTWPSALLAMGQRWYLPHLEGEVGWRIEMYLGQLCPQRSDVWINRADDTGHHGESGLDNAEFWVASWVGRVSSGDRCSHIGGNICIFL